MLDVGTNLDINCTAAAAMAAAAAMDDDMEPLFEDNWLQEHNLDILFDLFEEEMEGKGLDVAGSNSSTLFGSSPVTSYLFGTSPSLASALDLYDLLFDNQQLTVTNTTQHQNTAASSTPNAPTTNNSTATIAPQSFSQTTANSNRQHHHNSTKTYNISGTTNYNDIKCGATQQVGQNVSTNHIADSITNAMRMKRRLKKGQSEGVSLLARPNSSSNNTKTCNSDNINIRTINKSNSDKTSTKLTNFKKTIADNSCTSQGIDINRTNNTNNYNRQQQSHPNRNKHLHHYHHHVHYITGCSVIREHAYAVRGH